MAASPTQRTLAALRKQGYLAEVVEKWIPRANVRKDLFGFIDILAISDDNETVGIQATSYSNVSARRKKILESPNLYPLLDAKWIIQIWGWKKEKNGRYTCRVVDIEDGPSV